MFEQMTGFFSSPILVIVVSVVVAFTTTYLTIRFGPNRREVSRLASLVEEMAGEHEKEKSAQRFRCDVVVEDMQQNGANLKISSDILFKMLEISLATPSGAPFRTFQLDSPASASCSFTIPKTAINEVYFANNQNASLVLVFTIDVAGVRLQRTRGVSLEQSVYSLPNDSASYSYIRMSG